MEDVALVGETFQAVVDVAVVGWVVQDSLPDTVVVVTLTLVTVLVTDPTEEQVPVSLTVLVVVEAGPAGMEVVAVHWLRVLVG